MTQAPLLVFEGPIGAGKTTLASMLARHTGFRLFLEKFDENEFLSDFYADRTRWSLPMQLWFLAERHKQLTEISALQHTPIVADYSGIKNGVFAEMLLKNRESRLYASLDASLARTVRLPDVIVYLDASDSLLLERIKRRGRDYERHIDATYLKDLRRSYETHISQLDTVRVVRFDTGQFDLTSSSQTEAFYSQVLHASSS